MVSAKPDYTRSSVAWFVVLEHARANRDVELAAEAIRELRDLGIEIRYLDREAAK